jgi:hypothetical protein
VNKLHPIFEQALAPFLKPVATRNGPLSGCVCDQGIFCDECHEAMVDAACHSDCDCAQDFEPGNTSHAPDCHSLDHCDEGRQCDKHAAEAMAEHAWMRNVSQGAVTGVMSEQDKQDLRDAGKGHKVRP